MFRLSHRGDDPCDGIDNTFGHGSSAICSIGCLPRHYLLQATVQNALKAGSIAAIPSMYGRIDYKTL